MLSEHSKFKVNKLYAAFLYYIVKDLISVLKNFV